MSALKSVGVIGIGNELMGDDGIGPLLVRRLQAARPFDNTVRFINVGTGGIRLVHELATLDVAVIVDAGDFAEKAGNFRFFSPEDARSLKQIQGFSVHEWDLITTIKISKMIGEAPEKIYIMVIQPEIIARTEKLSQTLRVRIPVYEKALQTLLEKTIPLEPV